MFLRERSRGDADKPSHARNQIRETKNDAILIFIERENRIDGGYGINAAAVEQGQAAAKSARRDCLDLSRSTGLLESQLQQ